MGTTISKAQENYADMLLKKISNLPRLDIGNLVGRTQYIDFIKYDDVQHPLSTGIDCYKRPFLVVRGRVGDKKFCQTFFQRYTDGRLWVGAGRDELLHTSDGVKVEQFQFLLDLLDGTVNELTEDLRPCHNSWVGQKVVLE